MHYFLSFMHYFMQYSYQLFTDKNFTYFKRKNTQLQFPKGLGSIKNYLGF